MSHDQKSCDIYKRFNWHKQSSTTLELQQHHTMRLLSVDKLKVISSLHSGQTTCQVSSSTGFSIGTISKIYSEHFSDLHKSSGDYPVKLSPANVCCAVNFITSGKAKTVVQVSKAFQHIINQPVTPQTVCRHLRQTGMKAVVKKKNPLCHKSIGNGEWTLQSGIKIGLWGAGKGQYGQMRLKSIALHQMARNGLGKGQERG